MKQKLLKGLPVIGTFLLVKNIKYFYAYLVFGKENWINLDPNDANNIVVYSQLTLYILLGMSFYKSMFWQYLKLHKGLQKGFIIGAITTLPMWLGYGYMNDFEYTISSKILHRDLLAGFYEEFLYRGILFGLLYFYAGWKFIYAAMIPAFFFGLGHIYQAESAIEIGLIFIFTSLASVGFSWFYMAFKNLWVLIFLHAFMDLAWDFSTISTNVTGSLSVNIFRFMTLGIMIYLSLKELKTAEN